MALNKDIDEQDDGIFNELTLQREYFSSKDT